MSEINLTWLDLASLCHVSKQAKIKSGKTLSDKESPKYEVSENNFHFDKSTTHKSALLILNGSIIS